MFAYSTCVTEKYINRKMEQEANMTILNVDYFGGGKMNHLIFFVLFCFGFFLPPQNFLKVKKGIKIF